MFGAEPLDEPGGVQFSATLALVLSALICFALPAPAHLLAASRASLGSGLVALV